MTYELKVSGRARRLRITVKPGGVVVVTVPRGVGQARAERFVMSQQAWLLRTVAKMQKVQPKVAIGRGMYKKVKKQAQKFVAQRLVELNKHYGIRYSRVSIRNQKSRWGSASKSGTLSFSYKIIFLPTELQDYLIVHELCHLAEMNHSKRFWALVGQTIPNPKQLRREMHRFALY